MQLFNVDATIFLKRNEIFLGHENMKRTPSKVAHKVQSADLTCEVIKKVAPRTDVLNLQTK